MGKVSSFDKIKDILPVGSSWLNNGSTKTNWRKIKKHPDYEPHQEYKEWAYVDNIKNVLLCDFSDDLDFWWIPWKKWDLVVSAGTREEDVTTTLKSFEKIWKTLEDSKNDILKILDIYVPNHSRNKIIRNADKIAKAIDPIFVKILDNIDKEDVKRFVKWVDLSRKMMEEKVYMWVVSNVGETWITVSIGSKLWYQVDYEIPYTRLPENMKNNKFRKWWTVFVDVKKDYEKITLSSREEFNKPRLDALKDMNIKINGYETVFYMTKAWKLLKWKIIWLGDDVFGKQVIFQTKDGKKKFPITIDALKEWRNLAKQAYQKINNDYSRNNKNQFPLKKKPSSSHIKDQYVVTKK